MVFILKCQRIPKGTVELMNENEFGDHLARLKFLPGTPEKKVSRFVWTMGTASLDLQTSVTICLPLSKKQNTGLLSLQADRILSFPEGFCTFRRM